ncbi:60S acidic ribosomal protein P0, partial [Podochytrium sp. JEL0797]
VFITNLMSGIQTVAALSLGLGIPTAASVPHLLLNGFKKVLAVGLECDNYSFEAVERIKEALANPSAFAAAAPAAGAATGAAAAAPVAAKEEEKEEESDDDMGFGLFD